MIPNLASILIVEDSPDDLLLIERAFEKAKILNPLQVAPDGEQAIAYLEGENSFADRIRYPLPSLVLLDLRLPRKSGFDILQWIRRHERLSSLPVVMLGSSHSGLDIKRSYALGASSYLVKPVSPQALLQLVQGMNLDWMRFDTPQHDGTAPFA
jgi:CheY-like chemotaxis protein